MDNSDLPDVPKPDLADRAHSVAKVALNVAGQAVSRAAGYDLDAPLGELFSLVVTAPLEKRRDIFLQMIRQKVAELAETVELFRTPDFWHDPNFTTALLNAIPAALKTHQAKKLEALRNCVINSVILETVEDDMKSILYALLERITPTHLFVLDYVADRHFRNRPPVSRNLSLEHNGWIKDFDETFPELAGRHHAFYMALSDLQELGLIRPKPIALPSRAIRPMPKRVPETGEVYTPKWEDLAVEAILERTDRDEASKKGNMLNLWDTEITLLGNMLLSIVDEPRNHFPGESK